MERCRSRLATSVILPRNAIKSTVATNATTCTVKRSTWIRCTMFFSCFTNLHINWHVQCKFIIVFIFYKADLDLLKMVFISLYRNDASYSPERSCEVFATVCTRSPPTSKVSKWLDHAIFLELYTCAFSLYPKLTISILLCNFHVFLILFREFIDTVHSPWRRHNFVLRWFMTPKSEKIFVRD